MAARAQVEVLATVVSELNQLVRDMTEARAAMAAADGAEAEFKITLNDRALQQALRNAQRAARFTELKMRLGVDESEFQRLQQFLAKHRQEVVNIQLRVQSAEAEQAVQGMVNRLRVLDRMRADPELGADTTQFRTAYQDTITRLRQLASERFRAYIALSGDEEARRDLNDIIQKLHEAEHINARAQFHLDASDAERDITEIKARLNEIRGLHANASLGINDAQFIAALQRDKAALDRIKGQMVEAIVGLRGDDEVRAKAVGVLAELNKIDGKHAEAEADINVASAIAKATAFERFLNRIGVRKIKATVDVDTRRGIASANLLQGALNKVKGGNIVSEMNRVGASVALAGRILIGFAIASIGPLVGSLVIAAAAATGLAAAIGLLAAAAAPAVVALTKHKVAADALESAQNTARNAQEAYDDSTRRVTQTQESAAQSVTKAWKAYQDAGENVNRTAMQSARSVDQATQAYNEALQGVSDTVRQSNEQVADAARAYSQAEQAVADAVSQAHKRIEESTRALAQAEAEYNRTAQEVARQISDAWRALSEARASLQKAEQEAAQASARAWQDYQRAVLEVARTIEQANRSVASAIKAHEDAVESLARTEASVARQVEDAHEAATQAAVEQARTEEAVARRIADAYDTWRDAIKSVADARAQAAERDRQSTIAVQRAQQQAISAARSLVESRKAAAQATRAVADAQRAYNAALRDEPRQRLEAQLNVQELRIQGERAADEVARANQALAIAQSYGYDPGIHEAQLTYEEAQIVQQRNAIALARAEEELADTRRFGSQNLQSAADALTAAYERQRDAVQAIRDAELARNEAEVGVREARRQQLLEHQQGLEAIEEAQERVRDSYEAYVLAQSDGQYEIEQSQKRTQDSWDNYRQSQVDGAYEIQQAQERVAETAEAVALAEEERTYDIAQARQRATDAYQGYVDTVASGEERVAAQRQAVADAEQNVIDTIDDGNYRLAQSGLAVADARRQLGESYTQGAADIQRAYDALDVAGINLARAEDQRTRDISAAWDRVYDAADDAAFAQQEAAWAMADALDQQQTTFDELVQTENQANEDIDQALRDQAKSGNDLAYALAEVAEKAAALGASLTPAQAQLWADLIAFYKDFTFYFAEASEKLTWLVDSAVNLARDALPTLGQVAENTADSMKRVFDRAVSLLYSPPQLTSIWTILAAAPRIAESVGNTLVDITFGVLNLIAMATPDAVRFFDWLETEADAFLAWTQTAEAESTMDDLFRAAHDWAVKAWDVAKLLFEKIMELAQNPDVQQFADDMLDLTYRIVENVPALGDWFYWIDRIGRTIGELMPDWMENTIIQAGLMYAAFKWMGGGLVLGWINTLVRTIGGIGLALDRAAAKAGVRGALYKNLIMLGTLSIVVGLVLTFDWDAAKKAKDDAVQAGYDTGEAYDLALRAGTGLDPKPRIQWLSDTEGMTAGQKLGFSWQQGWLTALGYIISGGFFVDLFLDIKAKWDSMSWGDLGWAAIMGIWEAMKRTIPGLGMATWLYNELTAEASSTTWGDIGIAIIDAILAGLHLPSVDTISTWVQWLLDTIKYWFGIESPASTAYPIGEMIAEGILYGFWSWADPSGYIQSWIDWWYGTSDTDAQTEDWGYSGSWGSSGMLAGFYGWGDVYGYIKGWIDWWWGQSDTGAQEEDWGYSGSWGSSGMLAGFYGWDDVYGYIKGWVDWWWGESDSSAQDPDWEGSGEWGSSGMLAGFYGWGDVYNYIKGWVSWWWGESDSASQDEDWEGTGSGATQQIGTGMQSSTALGWITAAASWIASYARDYDYDSSNIGYWITRGIGEGMQTPTALSWISSAASWIVSTINKRLIARSPAKALIPTGIYILQGVAEGMRQAASLAANAASFAVDQISDVLVNSLAVTEDPAYMAGQRVGDAFADGLASRQAIIQSAAQQAMNGNMNTGPFGPGSGAAILTVMPGANQTQPLQTQFQPGNVQVDVGGITVHVHVQGAAAENPQATGTAVAEQLAATFGPQMAQIIQQSQRQQNNTTTRGGVGF